MNIDYIFQKRVIVLGNSVQLPNQLKFFKFREDDVIVRFNKAIFHEKGNAHILVANNVWLQANIDKIHTMYPHVQICCMQSSCNDARVHYLHNVQYTHHNVCLTSGVLFLLWLTQNCNTIYKEVKIAGFNMVDAGEKAHYYDNEKVPARSDTFPGHNKEVEHEILQNLLSNPMLNISAI